jgi:dipeptidyl aminopeptidase/acylaminoacyl peptidase
MAVVDAKTGASRWLFSGVDFTALDPAWSPTGDLIAFNRLDPDPTKGGLWIVGTDGKGLRRSGVHVGGQISWSPNGERLAVGDKRGVVVINVRTSRVEKSLADASNPVWTSNSTIEFLRESNPDRGADAYLAKWDVSTGKVTKDSSVQVHYNSPNVRLTPFSCP